MSAAFPQNFLFLPSPLTILTHITITSSSAGVLLGAGSRDVTFLGGISGLIGAYVLVLESVIAVGGDIVSLVDGIAG